MSDIDAIFDLIKHPDELESLADALKSVGTCQPWEDEVIFNAADILIGLSQIFKGIPVKESLPKDAEDVLVTDGSDVFVAWHTDDGWNSHSELFYPDSHPIVAWFPLPDFTMEAHKSKTLCPLCKYKDSQFMPCNACDDLGSEFKKGGNE